MQISALKYFDYGHPGVYGRGIDANQGRLFKDLYSLRVITSSEAFTNKHNNVHDFHSLSESFVEGKGVTSPNYNL